MYSEADVHAMIDGLGDVSSAIERARPERLARAFLARRGGPHRRVRAGSASGAGSGWKYRRPRDAEASAAVRAMAAAAVKTVPSPWWNGSMISRGKNSVPVRVAASAAGRPASVAGPSRCSTGLLPRKAANRVLTGGRWATPSAVAAGTPYACSPVVSVSGSEWASPATIREKNTPIDSAV